MLSSGPSIEGAHQPSSKNDKSQKRDDAIAPAKYQPSSKISMSCYLPVRCFAPAKYQAIPDRRLKGERYQKHTTCIDQRVMLDLCANISGF
jgi:hypothetical protein